MDQKDHLERNGLLFTGERQIAPDVAGIRRDHVERYRWASRLMDERRILDFGCGVGYGSKMMAENGHIVIAMDRSLDAIVYANEHYGHEDVHFSRGDDESLEKLDDDSFDVITAFEIIEHLPTPLMALREMHRIAPQLIVSVPNEAVFPYTGQAFHFRHYRKAELQALLEAAGYEVTGWYGQADMTSPVEQDCHGRTLIATAQRAEIKAQQPVKDACELGVPDHVAIVGLGPTAVEFMNVCKLAGGRHAFCDEVWGINAMGDILECDRIFHGDDMRIQESRAERLPDSNIARMVKWLETRRGPIYTSMIPPGDKYPGLVEFPLEDVLNNFYRETGGVPYFNSTGAYAVAFAAHIGVKKVSLYGLDYTLPDVRQAEAGRANVEFWLALGASRGMNINVPSTSTLFDAHAPWKSRLYGYDMVDVHIFHDKGRVAVRYSEARDVPTAAEVEARYDHSKPIAEQVRAGKET